MKAVVFSLLFFIAISISGYQFFIAPLKQTLMQTKLRPSRKRATKKPLPAKKKTRSFDQANLPAAQQAGLLMVKMTGHNRLTAQGQFQQLNRYLGLLIAENPGFFIKQLTITTLPNDSALAFTLEFSRA